MPAPTSIKLDEIRRKSEKGKAQKLKLFNRGNAISGDPINIGINQFPKPPIRTGITIKKIIIKACAVITTL